MRIFFGNAMIKSEFDNIYKEHAEIVFKFILKRVKYNECLAEELCQETFIKAFKYLVNHSINIKIVSTWLCSIAKNIIIDHYRKEKRRSTQSFDDLVIQVENSNILDSKFDYNKVDDSIYYKEVLDNALSVLKNKNFETFNTFMTYIETDDYKKTSQLEDICIGTTKSRIFRARKILMENLPDDFIALIKN